jgi:hypothetical protein
MRSRARLPLRGGASLVAVALLFGACGGETSTGEIASLEDRARSTTTEVGGGEIGMEEGLIAFSECLRENGLEVGDPTVGPDGSLQMPPIVVESEVPADGEEPDQAALDEMMRRTDAVFAECEPLLGEVAFTGGDLPDFDEFEDLLLEYAACMRDRGVDVPDPDFSSHGSVMLGLAGDPEDPEFAAADEVCRDILAGFDPMG